ncbi:OLC1v1035871C1 [Oldenlandia corymbosa var. corymbosa]|uniref:OLC1v1035871C1 n=1 Tax=Oldenlandia corymbosa var. corymbosa TaxID=529605 RepID=A0AAV1CU27_OLDCO|nr:OLC1v1035871C1 [Oldenlandia corymbosa var. corymbosa]
MILVVVGILSDMEPDSWEEVEESLNKGNTSITNQWIETLELSYRHLPEPLKCCFLYCGAFGEDQQIPARKLVWLWIAEELVVEKDGREHLEDVAEDYLKELINRNLVMIAKKGSADRVKTCVLHDLLHNFCILKANEECFLHHLPSHDLGKSIEPNMIYRLSVHYRKVEDLVDSRLIYSRLRSLLLDADFGGGCDDAFYSKIFQSRLLRVLEMTVARECYVIPTVILPLVHLKYLALRSFSTKFIIPPSFSQLANLETFIFYGFGGVYLEIELPNTLGSMIKLKDLYTRHAQWVLPPDNPEHLSNLKNLRNLSSVTFSSLQTMTELIRNFANIRKLKCDLDLDEEQHVNLEIVRLDFLTQLESLKFYCGPLDRPFQFPQKLKRLSLLGLELPWSKISAIHKLPNLEVLKLQSHSFLGDEWDILEEEETFPNLRFLKLEELDLRKWMASNDNFPCLKKLVLSWCDKLVELPTCLAESATLEMIEVCRCTVATESLKQIHEIKEKYGIENLKILIVE